MSDPADARLQRLLGGAPLAALRLRLRQHFERAPLDQPFERIRIDRLTEPERAALASLAGRKPRPSGSMQIEIGRIDAALRRAGIAGSLRDAIERLDGPIVHRASAREAVRTAWSDVIAGCTHAGLAELAQTPAGAGLLKRLAGGKPVLARRLCSRAEAVLQRLPARGIPRSQLAAEVLGDAHALDPGAAAASLVLAVWRMRSSPATGDACDPSSRPAEIGEPARAIWARAGVLVNELARPALFLNLPLKDGTANDGGRASGEPAFASLRALLRSPSCWDVADREIHLCENPNLLAIAADHWGDRCAPMVCTDGMPAAAQRCLLSQLTQAGARLCYHGDFDWPGLRIGNHVLREHNAQPWRFGAADYLAAIGTAAALEHRLEGNPVEAAWDDGLAAAMQQHLLSIPEEAVAEMLLADLDGAPGGGAMPC